MEDHPPMSETILVCAFSAAIFVFLSGLFTYGARKKAALTALIVVSLFIMQGSIMAFTKTPVGLEAITGLAEVLVASATGLLISYAVFRNKGWESPKST
ncbi:MAG TPA: hypothetical protein VFE54_00070 [Mucilaginibacter sp.]|nr:hypothetical protein [Mucilaginibacter sp.]